MHTFQCPHCREHVEVAVEHLDGIVTCSHCGHPFRAALPAGTLLEQVDGEWRPLRAHGAMAGEHTLNTLRPAVFRRAPLQTTLFGLLIVGGIFMAGYFGTGTPPAEGEEGGLRPSMPLAWMGLVVSLLGLAPLVVVYIQSRFESLTITNHRSIWRRGVFVRNVSEVEHEDIRNIQVSQGVTDQLLRVGRVSISSAGQDDMEISVRGVPAPDQVVELVRRQQAEVSRGPSARPRTND